VFTKQQVQTMKEDELRETVLLPLMRAMKFRHVYKYHGGVNEKGKDIVCWYEHPFLGNRRNVALVVKVRPISGKAAIDEATAGEITMQINQCFGKPYDDPITGEEQSVHECWVVSNKPISKDAIGAITAGLGKSVSTVQYVDIDTLWELIEKHLPLQAAFQKLAEAQQEFEQLDPQYRLDAHLTGSGLQFSLAEKYPGAAAEKPITIHTAFSFPDEVEAAKYSEALQQLLDTGASVTIPGTYVKSLQASDFLGQVLPSSLPADGSIQLGALPYQKPFLFHYEIDCDDGERFEIDYLDMKRVRAGTKEVTLSNQEQLIPIKIEMVLRFDNIADSHFHIWLAHEQPLNVHQKLMQLKFMRCMSKPHTVRITNIETGLLVATGHVEQGIWNAPDEHTLEIITALDALQSKTGKEIVPPTDRELTAEETLAMEIMRVLFLTGKIHASWNGCQMVGNVTAESQEELQQFLLHFEGGKAGHLFFSQEEDLLLFGEAYPLGRHELVQIEAQMANEDEVRTFLEQQQEGKVTLQFIPVTERSLVKEFPDWMPKDAPTIPSELGCQEQEQRQQEALAHHEELLAKGQQRKAEQNHG
jgi:hypothetical protein